MLDVKVLAVVSENQDEKMILALGSLSKGKPMCLKIDTARFAYDAYRILYSTEVDLLIIEETLFTPALNVLRDRLPVLVITSNRSKRDVGNISYYYKPIQPAYLIKKIQHIFQSKTEADLKYNRDAFVCNKTDRMLPQTYCEEIDAFSDKMKFTSYDEMQREIKNNFSIVAKISEKKQAIVEIPLDDIQEDVLETVPIVNVPQPDLPQIAGAVDITMPTESTADDLAEHTVVDAKWIILPVKTNYYEGDFVDCSGGLIGIIFDDGTSSAIQANATQLAKNETLIASDTKVRFVIDQAILDLDITVMQKKLDRLLMAVPCKLTYKEGDHPDVTSLQLLALYQDGTTTPVTDYCYEDKALTEQDQVIAFTYKSKTLMVPIHVKHNRVISIDLIKMPPQKFICGDIFTADGGIMKVYYQDGTDIDLDTSTKMIISECDMLKPGNKKVTLQWKGCSIIYEIDVSAKRNATEEIKPISLMIFAAPYKTNYPLGVDDLDLEGGVLNVFFSDQSCQQVPMDNSMGYELNFEKLGIVPVTVTYLGLKAMFSIKIEEPKLIALDVITPPNKTMYFEGEFFEIDGLKLKGTYNNDCVKEISEFPPIKQCLHMGDAVVPIKMEGLSVPVFIHVEDQPVAALSIKTPPTKTTYLERFDHLNLKGCSLVATLANGQEIELAVTEAEVRGFDNEKVGKQQLSFAYRDAICSYEIEILPKQVKSIEITKNPNRKIFCKGEPYDFAGIQVVARFDNGTMQQIHNLQFSKTIAAMGDNQVSVQYEGKTALIDVSVLERKLESIAISQLPTRTEYMQGKGIFSPDGGKLLLIYNDNTTEELDLSVAAISGFSNQTVGENFLTVSYQERQTTFPVMIQPRILMGITVTALPKKTEYRPGDCFDPAGIEITGVYNNGETEPVSPFGYEPHEALSVNDCIVTISVMDKKAIIPIRISEIGFVEMSTEPQLIMEETSGSTSAPVFYPNSIGLRSFD